MNRYYYAEVQQHQMNVPSIHEPTTVWHRPYSVSLFYDAAHSFDARSLVVVVQCTNRTSTRSWIPYWISPYDDWVDEFLSSKSICTHVLCTSAPRMVCVSPCCSHLQIVSLDMSGIRFFQQKLNCQRKLFAVQNNFSIFARTEWRSWISRYFHCIPFYLWPLCALVCSFTCAMQIWHLKASQTPSLGR